MAEAAADPLANAAFKGPGFLERFLGAILGRGPILDCIQIEVTSHCVGGCGYCPQEAQKAGWHSRHMSPQVFAALWPLLRQSARAHLQGWGEPLLHPRFFDFQQLASRAGCATSTTSCGLALDDALARQLVASDMDLVAFSLAGTDQASNAVRAKVPFERVCASIATLRRAIDAASSPLEIHIAYLLLADRMDAVSKLPILMEELGVDVAVVSTLDYLAVPEHRSLAFRPDDERLVAKARHLLESAAREAEARGRVLHFALPGPAPVPEGCRENVGRTVYVDAEGNMSPCIYRNVPGTDPAAQRIVYGNVLERDGLAMWRGEESRHFRRQLLGGNADEVCARCAKRHEG